MKECRDSAMIILISSNLFL